MATQNGINHVNGVDTRDVMKSFWLKHSTKASNQEVMLETNADKVMVEEKPEVLSFLPEWTGKKVIELAGGIGRFTGSLAERAEHVTTVDFMEKFIQKNRESNQEHDNITYVVSDVRDLNYENDSYDMIFSNWLLLYFTHPETKQLLQTLLRWVKLDGYLFFRESCNKTSANYEVQDNPSFYRPTAEFNRHFVDFVPNIAEDEIDWHLEIIFARPLLSYVKMKENRHQMCWLLRKRRGKAPVTQLPRIHISSDKQSHLKKLELKPGQRVLDIGCGDGACDFYMAKEYDVDVLGIDSSLDVVETAWKRQSKSEKTTKVCFEYGDITKRQLPLDYFDVIYVGKAMDDITDKLALINKFKTWLKKGGKIMVHEDETTTSLMHKVFKDSVKTIVPNGNSPDRLLLGEKTN